MNLLTIIVIAYLAIVIIRAFMKGFLGTLFSMMFLVLVILTTSLVTPKMKELFKGSENLQGYFTKKSVEFVENGGARTGFDGVTNAGEAAEAAVGLALSIAGVNAIEADQMTDYLMGLCAAVTTFILSAIAWLIIYIIFTRMKKHKAVKALDHILGIPLGAFRGVIFVWIVLGLISVLSFTRIGVSAAEQVSASPFLTFLYENNLLAMGIRKLLIH